MPRGSGELVPSLPGPQLSKHRQLQDLLSIDNCVAHGRQHGVNANGSHALDADSSSPNALASITGPDPAEQCWTGRHT
jgi:hypothetical protein